MALALDLERRLDISPAALAFGLRVLAEPGVRAQVAELGRRIGRIPPPPGSALDFEKERALRLLSMGQRPDRPAPPAVPRSSSASPSPPSPRTTHALSPPLTHTPPAPPHPTSPAARWSSPATSHESHWPLEPHAIPPGPSRTDRDAVVRLAAIATELS